MKKLKIAVFGSGRMDLDKKIYQQAEAVGRAIAQKRHILITGASRGVSQAAAFGAKQVQGVVIGISPTNNQTEADQYNVSFDNIDILIHTGMGYKGRNVISVRSCDVMIIINGQMGTLNEVAIGEGEGKPIIVLKNSGGCADLLKEIFKALKPEYNKIVEVIDPILAVALAEKLASECL